MELPTATIARLIGKSDTFVRNVYKKHGLIVPPEIKNAFIQSARIQKGNTPPNKGRKLKDIVKPEVIERMKPTQFKPGQKSHNYKPIGTERLQADGYIYLKIADPNRWKLKHHLIYEQQRGKIPPGFIIRFKDGNKQNFDIDNLILVSKRKNMQLNSIHFNYPAEVCKTIQLIGALNRQINKKAK